MVSKTIYTPLSFDEIGGHNDLEKNKFGASSNNLVAVRVITGDVVDTAPASANLLNYSEVSSLAKNTEATLLQYTVPVGQTLKLSQIDVSGDNVAVYKVEVDGSTKDTKRTWWTRFNESFEFGEFEISESINVTVKVIHYSNDVGDFNAKILGRLVNG